MAKINKVRVLLGGLLAGLVLNIGEFILNESLLGQQWQEAFIQRNLTPPPDSVMIWWIVLEFILGIACVKLYVFIRPRFGAGPRTAILAGLFVWFLVYLWSFGSTLIFDLWPACLVWTTIAWGLVEVPLATVIGAWLYKEDEEKPAQEPQMAA